MPNETAAPPGCHRRGGPSPSTHWEALEYVFEEVAGLLCDSC